MSASPQNGSGRSSLAGRNGKSSTSPKQYFAGMASVIERLPFETISVIIDRLLGAFDQSRAVYIFGNGGSAALASHCACDLGKGASWPGSRRLRVLSLTDNVPLLTAWANDSSYDAVFEEQLRNFLQPHDISFAISGSGNSPNVLRALEFSRNVGAFTIGLTGFAGGRMKTLCDVCVVVPSDNMQVIEDLHLSIAHSVFTAVRHGIENRLGLSAAAGR